MKYLFLSLTFLLSGCVTHSEMRERFDRHCEDVAQYEVSVYAEKYSINEPLEEVIHLGSYKKCMRNFGYAGEK